MGFLVLMAVAFALTWWFTGSFRNGGSGAGQASAGYYYAKGDPPGTVRYWDGTQWVGDPGPTVRPQKATREQQEEALRRSQASSAPSSAKAGGGQATGTAADRHARPHDDKTWWVVAQFQTIFNDSFETRGPFTLDDAHLIADEYWQPDWEDHYVVVSAWVTKTPEKEVREIQREEMERFGLIEHEPRDDAEPDWDFYYDNDPSLWD